MNTITLLARTLAALAIGLTALHSAYAADAEDVFDQLTGSWYEIEVVIFERPDVGTELDGEVLLREHTPRWPANLTTLDAISDSRFVLDAQTEDTVRNFRLGQGRNVSFGDSRTRKRTRKPAARTTDEDAAEEISEVTDPVEPPPPPTPKELFEEALGSFEAELPQASMQPLEELALSDYARTLSRRGMQLLWHQRWRQSLPPRGSRLHVQVLSGDQYGGGQSLEGNIAVTVGRYLHFYANLRRKGPEFRQPVDLVVSPDGVAQPVHAPTPGYLQLRESRRMRSEELHYLDHPRLGIIVRIDPVAIPEPLVELLTAANEAID